MKTIEAADVVAMIPDGASLMIGGFMAVGTPERLIDELVRQGKRNLTVIANDTAVPGRGIGKLVSAGLVAKTIASHIGLNPETQKQMIDGPRAEQNDSRHYQQQRADNEAQAIQDAQAEKRKESRERALQGIAHPNGLTTQQLEGAQQEHRFADRVEAEEQHDGKEGPNCDQPAHVAACAGENENRDEHADGDEDDQVDE